MVRMTGLEPARQRQRNLNPPSLPIPPHPHLLSYSIIVLLRCPTSSLPAKRLRQLSTAATRSGRLSPPQAALPSLPTESTNSTTSACVHILSRQIPVVNDGNEAEDLQLPCHPHASSKTGVRIRYLCSLLDNKQEFKCIGSGEFFRNYTNVLDIRAACR